MAGQYLENPRGTCTLGGAAVTLNAISGTVPIFHTGPGCPMMTSLGQAAHGGIKGTAGRIGAPCSVMLEKEIVFGGLDRLRETIEGTLEVFDGDLYAVISGCAAGIIGDDSQSVVSEFKERDVPIVYVDASGFKGDVYSGYNATLLSLIKSEVEPRSEKTPNLVNIFGIVPTQDLYWHGNLREIKRLLAGIGVDANIFFGNGIDGVRELRNAASASLNIFFSSWVGRGAEELLRNKFGQETLRLDSYPIGPTETTKFLREVSSVLGIDSKRAESFIESEESYIYDFYSGIAQLSSIQHHIGIIGDAHTIVSTLRFLVNDFSQIPVLAIVTDKVDDPADREAITAAIQKLEYWKKPDVLYERDQWNIAKIISEYSDDLTQLYGSQLDRLIARENKLGFVNHTFPNSEKLVLDKSYAGYKGSLSIIEDAMNNK
ncbi:MAG: nitrogen fixation protein NifK [Oscillospiraceae bacterium]|nr:nitrogen fixation protein NifK [Oscillospiraceae bacterium]